MRPDPYDPNVYQVIAVYEMPTPLAVVKSCFGQRLPLRLAGNQFEMHLPTIKVSSGSAPEVLAPALQHLPSQRGSGITSGNAHGTTGFTWGSVASWKTDTGEPLNPWIHSVALTGMVAKECLSFGKAVRGVGHMEGPFVEQVFQDIDPWFDALYRWVDVVVGQDTHHAEPMERISVPGQGLTIRAVLDGANLSAPRAASSATIIDTTAPPVNLTQIRGIVSAVNAGSSPSLARLILREGRIDLRRARYRKAVIDAGTASELALAQWCKTHAIKLPQSNPTLGAYVQNSGAPIPKNSRADLVQVRNDAIHNSVFPTAEQAHAAISTALAILDALDPLTI